jgi:hypothetical protein
MKVQLHGQVVDGPLSAEGSDGTLTATFSCADSAAPTPWACCDVVCRGSLALAVLLNLRAGDNVRVCGELRLHRSPGTGDDEDLVLATLSAQSVTPGDPACCASRIGHAVEVTCF